MVLQQWGLFETNSRLQKLTSAFLIYHSFIPCIFSFLLLSHFLRKCLVARVGGFMRLDRVLPLCLNCTFHCSMTWKQHSGFYDMHIYFLIPTSSPLPCYIFFTGMFWYIQFDSRGLTSPREHITLFCSPFDRFPHLTISWHIFCRSTSPRVQEISNF